MTDAEFDKEYTRMIHLIKYCDDNGRYEQAVLHRANLDTLIANKIAEEGDMFRDSAADKIEELRTFAKEVDKAVKHDSGKPPMELLSRVALEEISKVLAFGAKKYQSHNWRKGMEWSRLYGAAMRHLLAHIDGQDTDEESGLSHLAHLGCCVMFLLEYEKKKLGTDDRYKGIV